MALLEDTERWSWGSSSNEWSALVYGEFPLSLFEKLLRRAERFRPTIGDGVAAGPLKFCDVGSGVGRLVLATALLRPHWGRLGTVTVVVVRTCATAALVLREEANLRRVVGARRFAGVELLADLHEVAEQALASAKRDGPVETAAALERCVMLRTDMASVAAAEVIRDSDIIFSYATAFPTNEDEITVQLLSDSLKAAPLKPGTIVVTIDGWLSTLDFELLGDFKAFNDDVEVNCTASFWRARPRET